MDDEHDAAQRAERSAELFGVLARIVHRTAQDAAAVLRGEGLNPAQFQLLRAVRDAPGETQQTFGNRFGVTRGNVSMLVTKLVDAGLLVREPRGAANGLRLTPRGEALVERLEPDQRRFLTERFGVLDEAELATLHRLAVAVLEGLP
ncbi:MarR family winged helix-turn-helix transcriptional regulator [Geodermatophilus sp. SYSU D00766]